MKKYFIILMIVLSLFLYGCEKNNFDIGKVSDVEVVDKDVSFIVDEDTLTNTGVTVVLKNNSLYDITYGNPYELEIYYKDNWHKINVEQFFTMPAIYLRPGEEHDLEFKWKEAYGELEKGKYRIVKNITMNNDSFYVVSEFEIK